MRKFLSWAAGFAITFVAAFLVLLIFALSQPTLWLPVLFGLAFCGLLAFSPRIPPTIRAGLAILFGSVACCLWVISSSERFYFREVDVQVPFEILLGVFGLIGLTVTLAGFSGSRRRPAMWPIILLMLFGWLISYYSSSHGGASPMIDWVMHTLGLDRRGAETLVVAARKTGHFTFYGVVSLAGFALCARNGGQRKACYLAALLTTLVYASFDEARQSSEVDRQGSAYDVMLDLSGGSAAMIAVAAMTRKATARRPNKPRKSSTL